MDEREAHRFPVGPITEPGDEDGADSKERIRQLELESRPLDPDAEGRIFLRDKVVAYADGFMEELDRRPVYVASDDDGSALYDSPISEGPMDPHAVLELLD